MHCYPFLSNELKQKILFTGHHLRFNFACKELSVLEIMISSIYKQIQKWF